jgi:hypothetical protein
MPIVFPEPEVCGQLDCPTDLGRFLKITNIAIRRNCSARCKQKGIFFGLADENKP